MKILFPIGYVYPAENGGPALTIYWLAKALKKKGIDVFIFSTNNFTNGKVEVDKLIPTDFGSVVYLKTGNPNYSLKFIWYTISKIHKFDFIVITSIFAPSSILFAIYASLIKKRIVISPRGELDDLAMVYSKWLKIFILDLYSIFLRNNIMFHVTSQMELFFFRKTKLNNFKVNLIPNYMELPNLQTDSVDFDNILFIGRFHPKKGLENLIEALAISKEFIPSNLSLKLAGDANNPYGNKIKQLIKLKQLETRVKFVGEVKNLTKEKLYAGALFTIVPSHTENFGNVVIESLSQGTPVIASQGTPWEILKEKSIGLWVENDPISLSKAIDSLILLKGKNEYIEMRSEGRRFVEEYFNIDNGVKNWVSLFESLKAN
jgi:glycosyltransferase involved in cell wall biosynthesis